MESKPALSLRSVNRKLLVKASRHFEGFVTGLKASFLHLHQGPRSKYKFKSVCKSICSFVVDSAVSNLTYLREFFSNFSTIKFKVTQWIKPENKSNKIRSFEWINYYETTTGLRNTWDTCRKNPGHSDFIPFTEFSICHLSPNYQHDDIYDLIKRLAYLVVKIVVKRTSTSRPKYNKENRLYPPVKNSIDASNRFGSGRVWDVYKHENGRPCDCKDCQKSGNPKRSWGEVNVVTATHVVFDNLEGQFTHCAWSYNDPRRSNYVKFEGVEVRHANIETDLCYLRCVTHDLRLVDKLKRGIDLYNEQCEKVYNHFKAGTLGAGANLIAIVSHPHGRHKHVSLGERIDVHRSEHGGTTYSYTACTCSGSSGAPVYDLSRETVRWASHHHSGSDNPLNYSAMCWM